MSTPTQKHTSSRKNVRRASKKLKSISQIICPKCKKPSISHRACLFCGTYKGREAVKIRVPKKFRKKKIKEDKKNK
ncbi:50S ribosomal protein L32 [Candidatus Kuenenbacteria bacterium CG11_big_fil_rev_8_21_14_0_20_37_9]|uniref:Large ribosomal subunit protein bL32 n=2 Tax=Candidatus Kueneniibacteriota TaxID=1752740 RepID=A0A2M6XS30_9BACT|nr:MAG: 50S ribosomal protein L32 [Candidatus Kuenenbacteria bacterium CG1_02_38_13]PIR05625.1 MAG: 50S ribosomal protein L32 [Candidatus Kuenenbacteria bacterium CG11_big_fil_rev_8_21_14_0_20_37_9]PIU10440.1 MAG: 50S ribosomal protein L32 [Candidatus Kuenenbacteria bacterium CG08_land_8_20_14_0_20_37_23]